MDDHLTVCIISLSAKRWLSLLSVYKPFEEWLHSIPLGELGGTLFGAGLLSTLFEYSFRKEQEEATIEQFRQIIHEQAPVVDPVKD